MLKLRTSVKVKLNNKDSRLNLNSILLGILLSANLIASSLSVFIIIPNIFAVIVILLGAVSLLATGFLYSRNIFIMVCIVLLQFLLSYIYINSITTGIFLLSFLAVSIPSMFIASKPFDIYKTMKTIQVIAILCVPYIYSVINTDYSIYDSGLLMGLGYALLPVIASSLIILYGNYGKKWNLLAFINITIMLIASTKFISRGFFISLATVIAILTILKIKERPRLGVSLLILIFIILIPFSMSISRSVTSTQLYYNLYELKAEDQLNGRASDIQNILEYRSLSSVIFGSGVGSYFSNHKSAYIHNIFGMAYYETGIISALAILAIILKAVLTVFNESSYETKITIIFLLCTSVIRLMFSYNFWIDQIFWVFVSIMICKPSLPNKVSYPKHKVLAV